MKPTIIGSGPLIESLDELLDAVGTMCELVIQEHEEAKEDWAGTADEFRRRYESDNDVDEVPSAYKLAQIRRLNALEELRVEVDRITAVLE